MSTQQNRLTFKDYLNEVDAGDLQLRDQHAANVDRSRRSDADRNKATNDYDKTVRQTRGPEKGDVIMSGDGSRKFVVNGRNKEGGVVVTQLGGDKKQGTFNNMKYKETGKTDLGKTIYVASK